MNAVVGYRNAPQYNLGFHELLVDNFAGGGGASTGIEFGAGRSIDIAINHDDQAISMHTVNHPQAKHFCESVWEVDPREACQGRPVGLAWFSPDCRHFSKAKGAKPVSPRVRGLAWVALRWAATVRPRVIMIENVEEFTTWGPVVKDEDGNYYPCPKRKGNTFQSFVNALSHHGYQVEYRQLRACDYGAPTIRKRLFLIARCDGHPIVWPEPSHGPGKIPYRTAAEIIDWTIPCPSIFTRKRPLAENTLKRIAKGVARFVIDTDTPYVVGNTAAFLTEHANGSQQRVFDVDQPLRTQVASIKGGHFAKVAVFLAKHYGGVTGHGVGQPLGTITQQDHHSWVAAGLAPVDQEEARAMKVHAFMKYYGSGGQWQGLREPLHTVPTRARMGLVMVKGEPHRIVDIGMRMLQPSELYAAQGFPEDYVYWRDAQGNAITKTQQIAKCGNSVSPLVAEALVRANLQEGVQAQEAA